jgi:hypothetical protein
LSVRQLLALNRRGSFTVAVYSVANLLLVELDFYERREADLVCGREFTNTIRCAGLRVVDRTQQFL